MGPVAPKGPSAVPRGSWGCAGGGPQPLGDALGHCVEPSEQMNVQAAPSTYTSSVSDMLAVSF